MTTMSALATLLAPVNPADFLGEHLHRHPLHWRTSSPLWSPLRDLFAPDRLEGLLPRLESLHVWFRDRHGQQRQFPAAPSLAWGLYQAGMTLYGTPSPAHFPELAEVFALGHDAARQFGLPEGSFRLSFFATPRGGHTPPHFDNADGLTMQLHGIKRWSLAPATIDTPPVNHVIGAPSNALLHPVTRGPLPTELPAPAQPVTMEPGSMLYIPRGAWHATWTDEDAISLDFNFSSPHLWKEVVARSVDQLLAALPEARQPALAEPAAAPALDRLLDQLRAVLGRVDARAFLPPDGPRPASAALRWNPLATFFVEERRGDRVRLAFRPFRLPAQSVEATLRAAWLPVLDGLQGGEVVDAARLVERALPAREVAAVLDLLWQEGVLLAAER